MRLNISLLISTLWIVGCSPETHQLDPSEPSDIQAVSLQIQVLNDFLEPLAESSAEINGKVTRADSEGFINIISAPDALYELTFSASDYYSITHTFSEQERQALDGLMPAVTLVEKKKGRVMLAFGGDVMLGRRYHKPNSGEPRYISEAARLKDSKALLIPIKKYLENADYVSVNLESPILEKEPEIRSSKGIVFFSYPETLEALSSAGVDHVSLGNNHTTDYLQPGVEETLEYLHKSELDFSGAGVNEPEALKSSKTVVNNIEYRFLGFVGWPGRVKPSQVAEGNKGGAAYGSIENIVASVESQSKSATTVVGYHGSKEYGYGPTDETRKRLHAAIDTGADIVIGHHPHVLHGFELYKGKLIAYSLGNFMFDQYIYETHRSALLYVWMDGDRFYRAEAVPLYINGYRPTPAVGGVRDYVLKRLGHQSSREGLQLGDSGGHGTISATERPVNQKTEQQIDSTDYGNERVLKPLAWFEQLTGLNLARSGTNYRVGTDLWAIGDFEHENLFSISNQDWQFSEQKSAISFIDDQRGYGVKLVKTEGINNTGFGQKYFMRVWDEQPKSFVISAHSEVNADVQLCLELRAQNMGISEARANPVEKCLPPQSIQPGDWKQLVFDFDAPDRKLYRGLRFRLNFLTRETAHKASLLADNLMFVSWAEKGSSSPSMQEIRFDVPNRYNVMELQGANLAGCCKIISSR